MMPSDELKIIDNLVTANLLVTTTKDAIAAARYEHREAIKKAALAKTAYQDLLKKRLEARNAAQ
jgi:hypothetical protein